MSRNYLLDILILIILSITISCNLSKPKEYKIGLSINLSGTGGLSGEYIRDGAMLAVEEINQKGGINKIPLRLLIEDDKGIPEGAVEADKRLIEKGVVAIIGHSHSDTTLAAYPFVMSNNTILITAYTATNKLSNKDDYFFRTSVDTVAYGKAMVNHLKGNKISSVAFVIDNSNKSFGEEFYEETKKGIKIKDATFSIQSKETYELNKVVTDIVKFNPEAVCFLTEVTRTGIIIQKLRHHGYKGKFVATLWAQTNDLIKFAGKAVEGITIISFIDPEIETERYKEFLTNIKKRFPKTSPERAMRSYEVVYILADVLKGIKEVNSSEIKRALLSKRFDVVSGQLSFNEFGDVNRPIYNITVKDGKFVKKEKLF